LTEADRCSLANAEIGRTTQAARVAQMNKASGMVLPTLASR